MSRRLMGKKYGMTEVFQEDGTVAPCTVIHVEPNVVVQLKTEEADGYQAVQLGYEEIRVKDERTMENRCTKPRRGHFAKAGVSPRRYLFEDRDADLQGLSLGQEFGVEVFKDLEWVDVQGYTIGKGYQGVMKKHGFAGGPGAHGSKFHRRAGSTGMRSTPGRCLPGGKRASQMGNVLQTTQSLRVLKVDEEKGVILVKGAVPGHKGSVVWISPAIKKINKNRTR